MSTKENALDVLLQDAPVRTRNNRTLSNRCVVGKIVAELPEPYKTALVNQLVDRVYPEYEVHARLKAAGLQASTSAVGRHRRGQCVCESQEA